MRIAGTKAPRQHECSVCGKIGEWGKSWQWYGSYSDVDGGYGNYKPKPIIKMCSRKCRQKAVETGLTPRHPNDD